MTNFIARSGFALAAVAILFAAGCSPKVARDVNVSEGEYYTAEEFKNLSEEQYEEYCAELDAELERLQGEANSTESQADDVQSDLADLQDEIRTLQSRYDREKSEVDAVQEELDYFEGLPTSHVVTEGEFLQMISEYERIYADPTKWPRIYRANKDQIDDPNLIYPGWELVIPRDWPSSWTVEQDEYLSRIASYWEVYGNGLEWPRIYEANRDRISDPDMIWPDWELTIPRD
jgi:nucleoid-associated protein YgaU